MEIFSHLIAFAINSTYLVLWRCLTGFRNDDGQRDLFPGDMSRTQWMESSSMQKYSDSSECSLLEVDRKAEQNLSFDMVFGLDTFCCTKEVGFLFVYVCVFSG